MQLFSNWMTPRRAINRSTAWGCVAANLLLWPGLGSAYAGRKAGLVQMGLSGAGGVMAIIGFIGFCSRWLQLLERPALDDRYVLTGLAGIVLFVVTWVWALFGSFGLVRSAAEPAKLPPRLPPTLG